ncbi:sensor histidine kinase [Paenibacillus arenilitoris]|uniref:Sensor histidine kinase n=1 Tax=Paenibacillus arenilitoris TaxID=2772299 RepID=A0A927CGA3_9BACL|nr:sensor histidine kinase [Paenibacillus arenilitoris]MBD2867015.1 sensor histidine kinase [Paenibacillus arenilitoris]
MSYLLLRTLRGKIVLSLTILIFLPVVFIIYRFYDSSRQILETTLYESNQTALERKGLAMNEIVERTVRASNLIINDPDTLKYLRDSTNWTTEYSAFNSFSNLQLKLSNIRDLLLDSDAYLALYDFRGYINTSWAGTIKTQNESLADQSWFARTLDLSGSPNWTLPFIMADAADKQPLLLLTRLINSEWKSGNGVLLIGIPTDVFFYPSEELRIKDRSGIHLLLLDNEKVLLGDSTFSPGNRLVPLEEVYKDSSGISRIQLKDKQYLVNQTSLPGTGWILLQLTESKAFSSQLNQVKNRSIGWVLFWFTLFAIAFVGLTFRFTHPIKELIHSMNRVGRGDLNIKVAVRGSDEIALLGSNFNKMVGQLQELIIHLSEEQQRKQKAQFQALQAQINPHFLLNALNSIKWMALLSGANHVSDMMTKLGKLLTYTMRQQEEIVTIREELDYLTVFLAMQEIRYHDQIQVEVQVPEALQNCEIVKFTIQPIIENSIIHGNRFPLRILICARAEDDTLILTVTDNGVGMSEEARQQVVEQMNQPHAKYSGIGIRNVNDRIKLEYGPEYGISLDSVPDSGVKVSVSLPLRRRGKADEDFNRG